MQNKVVMKALKDLHGRYVTTPIDKASGNVAFISKKVCARTFLRTFNN